MTSRYFQEAFGGKTPEEVLAEMVAEHNKGQPPEHTDTYDDTFAIAYALCLARLRKKITQQELAEKVGMKQSMIVRLEKGNSNPNFLTLQKLAKALDLQIALIPKTRGADERT